MPQCAHSWEHGPDRVGDPNSGAVEDPGWDTIPDGPCKWSPNTIDKGGVQDAEHLITQVILKEGTTKSYKQMLAEKAKKLAQVMMRAGHEAM